MLETIAVILLTLWGLGLLSSYSMGGFIHVLLVIAIVVVLIRVIRGRGSSVSRFIDGADLADRPHRPTAAGKVPA